MHASRLVVISEPLPYASAIAPLVYIYDNERNVVRAGKSFEDSYRSDVVFFGNGNPNTYYLDFYVITEARGEDNKYELPSGSYIYRTTISCLQ